MPFRVKFLLHLYSANISEDVEGSLPHDLILRTQFSLFVCSNLNNIAEKDGGGREDGKIHLYV